MCYIRFGSVSMLSVTETQEDKREGFERHCVVLLKFPTSWRRRKLQIQELDLYRVFGEMCVIHLIAKMFV